MCNFAGGWGWVEGSYPQKKFPTVDIVMLIVQQKIKYIVELARKEGVFCER